MLLSKAIASASLVYFMPRDRYPLAVWRSEDRRWSSMKSTSHWSWWHLNRHECLHGSLCFFLDGRWNKLFPHTIETIRKKYMTPPAYVMRCEAILTRRKYIYLLEHFSLTPTLTVFEVNHMHVCTVHRTCKFSSFRIRPRTDRKLYIHRHCMTVS